MIKKLKSLIVNSYAPYSNFVVASIIVYEDGSFFEGVNVENVSFGGTICAERNAIATAISIYIYNVLRSILVYVKLNLNPFSSNYLKVIPFIFLPFILNYFISTNNLFFNAIINTLLVLVVLIFPVYKLKLSKDFNKIIEELLKRLQF